MSLVIPWMDPRMSDLQYGAPNPVNAGIKVISFLALEANVSISPAFSKKDSSEKKEVKEN